MNAPLDADKTGTGVGSGTGAEPGAGVGAKVKAVEVADPRLAEVLQAACEQGLLPADAQAPKDGSRPWPVVLLTALGAWLAALPLLGVVGMLLGDLMNRSVGPYFVGALLITGAVVVLRSRGVALFVEQLALPVLLVGAGALGFGLFRDFNVSAGAVLLGGVALAVGLTVPAAWLRVLLGAAVAVLWALAFTPHRWGLWHAESLQAWWVSWHLQLGAWLVAIRWLQRGLAGTRAAALESLAVGAGLALLVALAGWSGMTFLVGGVLGSGPGAEIGRELGWRSVTSAGWLGMQALSALLAAVGGGVALRRWPGLRQPPYLGAAGVLVALAALMPSLGATLLLLAQTVTSGRRRLAVAAAVAAAWIVGAFYYQLAWPLGSKALVLVAAGALLALLAGWAMAKRRGSGQGLGAAAPVPPDPSGVPARNAAWWARAGIALSLIAVLAVANLGIRDKEALIRHGQPVFVELAPVDPRSLMQGDFMRLNFDIPGEPEERRTGLLRRQRPHVVAVRDERGVARLLRIADGQPLAAGEMHIELTPKDGRWTLVSDAWFFAEGQAQRWEKARYGEFRVDAEGRALLVGLRGAALEAL